MRYTYNNVSLERVDENTNNNSIVEREPTTDHVKKFHTRVREISKEIAHGNFRLKSVKEARAPGRKERQQAPQWHRSQSTYGSWSNLW